MEQLGARFTEYPDPNVKETGDKIPVFTDLIKDFNKAKKPVNDLRTGNKGKKVVKGPKK